MNAKRIVASVVACLVLVLSMTMIASAEGTATELPEAVNGVIMLTEDVTLAEKITINGDITLDLNGKTLTLPAISNNYAIVVKDTLTIKDSGENGTIVATGGYGIGTTTDCTGGLNIESGNYISTHQNGYLIGAYNGQVKISGGNFTAVYCILNCFADNHATAEIIGGNFEVTGTEYWSDPFLGVNISVEGGTFSEAIPAEYLAEGQLTSKNAEGVYEVVTAEAKVTASAGEGYPVYNYASFEEAIESVKEWDTVTLLDDVSLTEKIVVDKYFAVDGNGFKITTSAKKLFEVFADFEVSNLNMESTHKEGRCVDTRVDNITVTIDNCELLSSGSVWAQPLTIGGSSEGGLTVNVTDSKITSNKYTAIIMFVPAELTIENSEISGYAAIYAKGVNGNTTGSVIAVKNSDLISKNAYQGPSNSFATVVIEDDGVTVTVDAASSITAESTSNDANQAALNMKDKSSTVTLECPVTVIGDVTSVLSMMNGDGATLTVTNPDVIEAVKAEGYDVDASGVVTVPEIRWVEDTDAGFYLLDGETKLGLLRFLFAVDINEEITASGIKYIKPSNIAEGQNAQGVQVDGAAASVFYGDINGIPETEEGKRLIAIAYVTTANGTTYWSSAIEGVVDMTSQQFTDYNAGGAQ